MPDVEVAQASLDDLHRLANAYQNGGKAIQKGIRDGLRAAGKPLARQILTRGAERMPQRGGLRARLASSNASISSSLSGRNPIVRLTLGTKKKGALSAIDRTGIVRHPVWARPDVERKDWTWTAQNVPAHTFTDAFEEHLPQIRGAVSNAVQAALDDIARKA